VAPVTVPAAGETVTSDKWAGRYPDLTPTARRTTQGGSVAPLYVPDVTVVAPPLAWQPIAPDLLNRRPSSVYDSTVTPIVVAAPETITLDKWEGSAPDRVPVALRVPQGGTVAPLYVPDVTVVAPPLSWQALAADRPTRRPNPVFDSTVAPVSVQAPAETVTLDKWAGNAPEPLRRAWRPLGGAVAPLYVPDVTVVAPPLSWLGTGSGRPAVLGVRPYDSTVAPVTTAAPAETITLDKWQSPAVVVARAVRRQPGGSVAPLYVADVTVVPPLLSWSPIAPAIVPRLRVLRPLGAVVANVEPILYTASYRYIVAVPFEQRRVAVPRESRLVVVGYETRAVVVRYENRTAIVPQQPRTAAQED
jgi:predicted small lipoprotein YifL